jgi:uncharacterized RDD family membrane protein YckC
MKVSNRQFVALVIIFQIIFPIINPLINFFIFSPNSSISLIEWYKSVFLPFYHGPNTGFIFDYYSPLSIFSGLKINSVCNGFVFPFLSILGIYRFLNNNSIRLLLFMVLFSFLALPEDLFQLYFCGFRNSYSTIFFIVHVFISVLLLIFMNGKIAIKSHNEVETIVSVSKKKRFYNFLIDRLFIFNFILHFFLIVSSCIQINDSLRNNFDSMKSENIFGLSILLYAFFYYLFSEGVFQITLGKIITKTIVVNTENQAISFSKAFKRTICRFIPFDSLSFLFGKEGWHDSLTYTYVVDCEFDGIKQ